MVVLEVFSKVKAVVVYERGKEDAGIPIWSVKLSKEAQEFVPDPLQTQHQG